MEIKERILQNSQDLFMRYGIKTMTMDDIAKHLCVSKKTIYQHFKDKNELVEEVLKNHLKCEQEKIETIRRESENAVEELFKISKFLKTMMMDMNPSLFLDMQKYHPNAYKYFQEHKHECITTNIYQNLVWGVEEGYYLSDINCELLALLRVEQIELGFNPMSFGATKFSIIEVQVELLNHFIRGIITPNGQQLYNEYQSKNA